MAALVHVALGFASKPVAKRVPVLVSIVAAEFLDLLAILLALVGVETAQSVPYSHGLLMSLVWSLAFAGVSALVFRNLRTATLLGLLVFSHWVVDFITHPMGAVFGGRPLPPDLPLLFDGSPRVGLGLYNFSLPLAYGVEYGSIVAGILVYLLYTLAARRARRTEGGSAPPSP